MNINKEDFKKFSEQGFLVIKSKEIAQLKDNLTTYLSEIILHIVKISKIKIDLKSLIGKTFHEQIDLIVNKESNQYISKQFFELNTSLLPVIALLNNDLMLNIAKAVGIQKPVAGTLPVMRLDRPNNDYHSTPLHQDYWYSMLSDNSITIWFGLVPLTSDMGFLEVFPGTHKKGLVAFQNNDKGHFTTVEEYDEKTKESIKLEYDEILVFSQYLLHKSGKNISNKTRVSIQVRFNDLKAMEKIATSFTTKPSVFLQNKQKNSKQS